MINIEQFRELIIEPTLEDIGMYSLAAVELVLGTALQESRLTYLVQLDGDDSPYDDAIGFYQVEAATHDDVWDHFLRYREDTRDRVLHACHLDCRPNASAMAWNLRYATAMCRLVYRRVRWSLPEASNIEAQAAYWKDHYNTAAGHGTVDQYIRNWERAHQ